MIPKTIAIDGPAASGKSTIAKMLAESLNYLFFDTGVMYRAVTWVVLQRGMDCGDENAVTEIAQNVQIDVRPPSIKDGRACDVSADGDDITWDVRSPEVDDNVSEVSTYPGVRHALTVQQRRVGSRGKVVMVGRDIGTVVLPDADLKIYLDASVEERARRRYAESTGRGESADYDLVLENLRKRDQIDSSRDVAPLKIADDAVVIDSDGLSIAQVLAGVESLVNNFGEKY